jgi:hypothetical protein
MRQDYSRTLSPAPDDGEHYRKSDSISNTAFQDLTILLIYINIYTKIRTFAQSAGRSPQTTSASPASWLSKSAKTVAFACAVTMNIMSNWPAAIM